LECDPPPGRRRCHGALDPDCTPAACVGGGTPPTATQHFGGGESLPKKVKKKSHQNNIRQNKVPPVGCMISASIKCQFSSRDDEGKATRCSLRTDFTTKYRNGLHPRRGFDVGGPVPRSLNQSLEPILIRFSFRVVESRSPPPSMAGPLPPYALRSGLWRGGGIMRSAKMEKYAEIIEEKTEKVILRKYAELCGEKKCGPHNPPPLGNSLPLLWSCRSSTRRAQRGGQSFNKGRFLRVR